MDSHRLSDGFPKRPSTPVCRVRRAEEFCQHSDGPQEDEQQETHKTVPKARRAWRILGTQIDLYGVVENEEIKEKKRAGEPRTIVCQKRHRLRHALGRQPVVFVWQINQLWWQSRNNLWHRESNARDKDTYDQQNLKERLIRFAMPKIISALPTKLINLPNKNYWLAPERVAETMANPMPATKTLTISKT